MKLHDPQNSKVWEHLLERMKGLEYGNLEFALKSSRFTVRQMSDLKAEKQHAVTRFVHQRALCNTFVRAAQKVKRINVHASRKENELKYLASVLKKK